MEEGPSRPLLILTSWLHALLPMQAFFPAATLLPVCSDGLSTEIAARSSRCAAIKNPLSLPKLIAGKSAEFVETVESNGQIKASPNRRPPDRNDPVLLHFHS